MAEESQDHNQVYQSNLPRLTDTPAAGRLRIVSGLSTANKSGAYTDRVQAGKAHTGYAGHARSAVTLWSDRDVIFYTAVRAPPTNTLQALDTSSSLESGEPSLNQATNYLQQ